MIKNLVKTRLPTGFGDFSLFLYLEGGKEHLALVKGNVSDVGAVPVRVHSECLTGDVFASRRCDCGDQLKHTLMYLGRQDAGILIYLRQEGRGIGLLKKMEAYNLQDQGFDTVEANLQLGHQPDERDYGIAARILRDLGVSAIRLITNNPHKVEELEGHGIEVAARIPIEVGQHEENLGYLKSKAERMAHLLRFREQVPADHDYAFLGGLLDQLAMSRDISQQRPFVTLIYAQSLDGVPLVRVEAVAESPRDQGLKGYLSVHHDAILTTAKTALAEGHSLMARMAGGPLQVILDPLLLWEGPWVEGQGRAKGILVVTDVNHARERRERLEAKGIRVVTLSLRGGDGFDPSDILGVLASEGLQSVLVHGDEDTIGAFLASRRVDYCVITLAPCFVGGPVQGLPEGQGLPQMRSCAFHPQGSDLVAFGALSYSEAPASMLSTP